MTSLRDRSREKVRDGLEVSRRAGLVAYGLLHLLVAWVTVELAFGGGGQNSSGQGALRQLAASTLGRVLVWAISAAMAAFCLARIAEGWAEDEWKDRVRPWAKAVVYAAISVSAVGIASHSGGGGPQKDRTLSARVMDVPGGTVLIVLVGIGILAVGLWQCYHGLSRDFRDELSEGGKHGEAGKVYLAFGQVGYTAKGVVIALVGILVGYAGLTHDPQKTGGLDAALQTVRDQPFGPVLLCTVAAGIASYGLFCIAQARHLSR